VVYDGRNILDPELMKRGGVEYYSIGRLKENRTCPITAKRSFL